MFERLTRCSGFYAGIMMVAMVCIGLSSAIAEEARTLQILRDKGIISQEEYDQAIKEEKAEAEKYREKEKQPEKKPEGLTKNGLQVKLGASPNWISWATTHEASRKSSGTGRSCAVGH